MPASQPTRIAIVGAGNVGATAAYALLLSGLAAEIVLIDVNRQRAEGEAMDLAHAVPFSRPTRVWAGGYEDCAGATVTIIAAGTAQRPGETRLDLVRRNAAIFAGIVPQVAEANPEGIIVVTTNPVDVLTYSAWKLSGLSPSRVIGSGTTLDTGRFRALLGDHFRVDPRSVHAFIIGEHGDSEVPIWSSANVAGVSLEALAHARDIPFGPDERDRIFRETRDAAYAIIERKGATYYAVADRPARDPRGDRPQPADGAVRIEPDRRRLRPPRRLRQPAVGGRERRHRGRPRATPGCCRGTCPPRLGPGRANGAAAGDRDLTGRALRRSGDRR